MELWLGWVRTGSGEGEGTAEGSRSPPAHGSISLGVYTRLSLSRSEGLAQTHPANHSGLELPVLQQGQYYLVSLELGSCCVSDDKIESC